MMQPRKKGDNYLLLVLMNIKGDRAMKEKNYLEIEKLKTESIILSGNVRFNPNHDSKGRFTTGGGGAGGSTGGNGKLYAGKEGRNYGVADTSDAIKELRKGKQNSLGEYLDENGNLTPERAALHKQIIDDYLASKKPVEGQAEMIMMGGGPASGKSSAIKSGQVNLPEKNSTVTVDPDDIKKKLPGYKEMTEKTDKAAEYYHEESSMIAKQLANVSFDENYNVVYDGTGDGSEASVLKKINNARSKGYRVTANYVTVDSDEAVVRNKKRYDDAKAKGENPRLVPEDYVRECHAKVSNISMATSDQFDEIKLFDNNGPTGSKPILIAQGGNGKKLTATKGNQKLFDKYIKKGTDYDFNK